MAGTDWRAQYTEKVIRESFYELLDEVGSERITVSEICRRAHINRGTFYLHYRDAPELMDRLGEEFAESLISRLGVALTDAEGYRQVVVQILTELSTDRRAAALIFHSGDSRCFDRIFSATKELVIQSWTSRSDIDRETAELLFSFISGGAYALTREYYYGSYKSDISHVSELIFKLMQNGLASIVCGIG